MNQWWLFYQSIYASTGLNDFKVWYEIQIFHSKCHLQNSSHFVPASKSHSVNWTLYHQQTGGLCPQNSPSSSLPFPWWLQPILEQISFSQEVVVSRDDSRFAPSQWETSLQSNAISHWLGANLEPAPSKYLLYCSIYYNFLDIFYMLLSGVFEE